MEEAERRTFKTKFIRLTILLNLIVLLFAGGVIAFFMLPADINMVIAGVLIVAGALLLVYFFRSYKATKIWLEKHTE
jgi:flagellar basal body-associated protein FliL